MNIKAADASGVFTQGELGKKVPIGSAIFHVSGGGGCDQLHLHSELTKRRVCTSHHLKSGGNLSF